MMVGPTGVNIEIERKFLVESDAWRPHAPAGRRILQAYLASSPTLILRVRILDDRDAVLTIKGARTGISRPEFEYPIPVEDAQELVSLSGAPFIEKIRYRISHGDHVWDLDEYFGENQGLLVAEVELSDEQEDFSRPAWLGLEVTGDSRFSNASLALRPYKTWQPRSR